MKTHLVAVVATTLLTISMSLFSAPAFAQKGAMPTAGYNPYSWMTHLNNVGNQQVAKMYYLCTHNPGACRGLADQQSLNQAIQGVQNQSLINSQRQQKNLDVQTHAVGQTNCAITGGTTRWNPTTQQNECYH